MADTNTFGWSAFSLSLVLDLFELSLTVHSFRRCRPSLIIPHNLSNLQGDERQ